MLGSLMAALFFLAIQPTAARAQPSGGSGIRGYDYTGVYVQAGAAVGEVHARGDSDDASGGFTLGGGYRILPWLSAEGNFTFLGNSDDEFFDHIGVFVEGGGHAASKNHVDGAGIFTLGGQYRF